MGHKSATTKLSERTRDFYPTPDFATEELLKRVPMDGTIFECCAGDGRMADVLRRHLELLSTTGRARHFVRKVITNDIDRRRKTDYHRDMTKPHNWRTLPPFDWVVTNPPNNVARFILPLAHEHAKVGVAFLVRLSYLEPTKNRYEWLIAHKPHGVIITPRISFTIKKTVHPPSEKYPNGRTVISKTDCMTTVWCVWYKQRGMSQFIDFIAPPNGNRK